jgi:hypothetical protein
MKKIFLITLIFISAINFSNAREFRLNLYSAYSFPDHFNSYYDAYNYYEGKFQGGYQWGGGLEFMPDKQVGLELCYLHLSTTAPTTYLASDYFYYTKTTEFDVNFDYILLVPTKHMRKEGSKVEGYAGLPLGMGIVNVKNPETGSSGSGTKFCWGLRLGGNIWISNKVALNLQGQFLSLVQAAGGTLYFGTGGAGAGLSGYSTVFQFNLGGGLTFAFGE